MGNDWRLVGYFAAGLAIGAVATATLVMGPYAPGRNKSHAEPAARQAAMAVFRGAECPLAPVALVAGAQDGRYRMPADLSGYSTTDPRVFLAMGGEAASAGRAHDAEIAYLMACRVADRYRGPGSAASADARFELARHYGALAQGANKDAAQCGEMLMRAETLYSDSLQLYRASHGAQHEKSRQAAQGLADVRQVLMAQAGAAPVTPASPAVAAAGPAAPAESPAPLAQQPRGDMATSPSPAGPAAKPQGRAVQLDKASPSTPQRRLVARQARPSPACAAARTAAERLICSDAELARLDRELGHLQARARNAWKFEDEWRRREASCQDRACLLRVFSQKRSQLLADVNSA